MANMLTISRLILIPLFLYLLFSSPPRNLIAAVVFGLAGITDALDGYVARKFDQVTELGKIIDPLADRIFIVTAVIALYVRDRQPPLFALIILLTREIVLLWGYVYLRKQGKKLSVSFLGKTATAVLITAFVFMIMQSSAGPILFYIGLGLYIVSALDYMRVAAKMTFS